MKRRKEHYQRWPILDLHVGSPEVGEQPATFEGQVSKFRAWIHERMAWLSDNMPGSCLALNVRDDIDNSQKIRLYPNPVTDFLYIETDLTEVYSIELTTLNGQLIFSTGMEDYHHQIDLSPYPRGVYFISIRSKAFVKTEKIIKLK